MRTRKNTSRLCMRRWRDIAEDDKHLLKCCDMLQNITQKELAKMLGLKTARLNAFMRGYKEIPENIKRKIEDL